MVVACRNCGKVDHRLRNTGLNPPFGEPAARFFKFSSSRFKLAAETLGSACLHGKWLTRTGMAKCSI